MFRPLDLKISSGNHLAPAALSSSESSGWGELRDACQESSIGGAFLRACEREPERPAVIDSSGTLSYRELERETLSIANSLRCHSGFHRGVRVGLVLENSIEYIIAFYAIQIAGGVCVPTGARLSTNQLSEYLELADVSLVLSSRRTCSILSRVDLLKNGAPTNLAAGHPDHAVTLFTSGTSGAAKGVMLSHQNVLANARSICDYLPISSNERTLALMPFAHALGNSVLQTHILSGATVVVADNLSFPTNVFDTLQKHRCTSLSAVPEVYELLLRCWPANDDWKQQLSYLAVAGGKLDANRARQLAELIRPAKLFLMYGQTEATARLAYLPPETLSESPHAIGQPIPGVELEIRDEQGQPVRDGVVGTLFAKGPNIMLGYWGDPEGTRTVLQDGWLNTGDLALKNENGQIELHGRKSGLIKIQGYRFHPSQIERRLLTRFPGAQIVAIPFDFGGQTRLALAVASDPASDITVQHIRRACSDEFPRHMIPTRIEVFRSLPRSAAGKTDRNALRRFFESSQPATNSVPVSQAS